MIDYILTGVVGAYCNTPEISPPATQWIGGVARSAGVVLCHRSVNPCQDFIFDFQNRPPRPDSANARPDTPPFSRVARVGGEIPALFLFLTLFFYISLKLEKHENVFYPIPSSPHHLISFCPVPLGYSLPSGDAQCRRKCNGE